ncbi:hypothetical protein GCM10023063_48850 [Arthrobacter methylotrophus]
MAMMVLQGEIGGGITRNKSFGQDVLLIAFSSAPTQHNDELSASRIESGRKLFIAVDILTLMPDMERWPTGRLLSTAARLVEHAWNEKLRGMGLTHAGVIVMKVLAVKGPTTQSMLAQIVRVQAQTMGKTLTRWRPTAISAVRAASRTVEARWSA